MMTRRHGGVVLCACVIAGLGGGCQSPSPEAAKAGGSAWGPTERSKDKTAVASGTEPDVMPRTHYAAGRLHESQQQLNRAVEQYRAAVSLDPKHVEAYNGLGVCLTRLGNYRQAEEQFVKAIELAPDRAHLRNNLAFCYISQRRWADAEAELRNALELKPEFARARINLAMSLAQQGKFDGALEAFRVVLKEEDAQFNMGLMYQSVGRYAEAGEAFRAALEKNPRMAAAKERLEKVRPLMEKAQKERAKAEAVAAAAVTRPTVAAAPATRPAVAVAPATQPAVVAAPATQPAVVVAGAAREPARSEQLASPMPRIPTNVMPAAREALTTLAGSWKRLVAMKSVFRLPRRSSQVHAVSPGPFQVICEATAEAAVPEDLDVPDNLWLSVRDPAQAAAESGRIGALEEGIEEPAGDVALGAEATEEAGPDLTALPTSQVMGGGSILIGATLLPDDPFRAFPQR